MSAILFDGAEPFEPIINTPKKESPVKTGQAISEKKTFKDYMILYLYIAMAKF